MKSEVRVVNTHPGHIMLDTGCERSVAGPEWHRAMQSKLHELGPAPTKEGTAHFVFGSGKAVRATCRWVYPIAIRGRPALLDVAEVPCNCPGLMSKASMKRMGMTLHLEDDTVDIRTMDLKSVPVLQTNTGHPVIDISQFDSVEQESFLLCSTLPGTTPATRHLP